MIEYHNVGLGMVPHKEKCRCDECTIQRLEAKVRTMQAEIETLKSALEAQYKCAEEDAARIAELEELVEDYETDIAELYESMRQRQKHICNAK